MTEYVRWIDKAFIFTTVVSKSVIKHCNYSAWLPSNGSGHLGAKAPEKRGGKQPRQHQTENELKINGRKIIAEIRGWSKKKCLWVEKKEKVLQIFIGKWFLSSFFFFYFIFMSSQNIKIFFSFIILFLCWFFLGSYFCVAIIKIYLLGPPWWRSKRWKNAQLGCMITRKREARERGKIAVKRSNMNFLVNHRASLATVGHQL